MYISSLPSSSHADGTDFPESLSLSLSLSLFPIRFYHPSLPAGPPTFIRCPHRADVIIHPYKPTLVCRCVGVHRRTLLMSSSLLLQQYTTCLVCLTWIVLR